MKSILITGGCGFVGSNLALHLRDSLPADVKIVCLDNLYRKGSELNIARLEAAGIEFLKGDVRHAQGLPQERFDLLIECSAEPSVLAGTDGAPDYLFNTNVVGLYHCLEKCRRDGAGMIFLSTSRVYPVAPLESQPFEEKETRFSWLDGGTPGISCRGVSEELDMKGVRSLYGFTKLAAEQLIEEYRAAFGVRAVVNRCGIIAGPWQFGKADQGVVALWVMAHLMKRPLSYIGYGGQGKQVRDLLHVMDLCQLVGLQVRHFDEWEGWLGNVSGGVEQSVSLNELTTLCGEVTGVRMQVGAADLVRPLDLRIYIGDCGRLSARTQWRPQRGVSTIVEDTARWVREHQEVLAALW